MNPGVSRQVQRVVAVIGGGAAGAMTAAAVAATARELREPVKVVVIESRPKVGKGLAYSTSEPAHLLNVPAGRMPACPGASLGFVDWLRGNGLVGVRAEEFVPRAWFGAYLAESWRDRTGTDPWVEAVHLRERAVALHLSPSGPMRPEPTTSNLTVSCASGRRVRADSVVLALGNLAARTVVPAPEAIGCERYVQDPWTQDLAVRTRNARTILLIGTGLTTVDVAPLLHRSDRVLTAVSSSGELPRVHRSPATPPVDPPAGLTGAGDLAGAYGLVADHLRCCLAEHHDWRPAVDGLRPLTAAVWQRLSLEDRSRALRAYGSWWNRHRHRMPPSAAERLRWLLDARALRLRKWRVEELRPDGGEHAGVRVRFTDGTVERFDAVVNCAGRETDYRCIDDPLVSSLLRSGSSRPGPLGLGLDTDPHGQVLDQAGAPVPGLHTLGVSRIGQLWETTAAAEIAAQAGDLGHRIMAAPARRAPRSAPPSQARSMLTMDTAS